MVNVSSETGEPSESGNQWDEAEAEEMHNTASALLKRVRSVIQERNVQTLPL